MAMHPLDAVRGTEPAEAVPLDHAGKAPSLAGARHVDPLDLFEQLDGQRLTLGHVGRTGLPHLADEPFWLGVDLAGMAPLGLGGLLALLVVETQLHGVIAVAVFGPYQEHGAWTAFQDRDRHRRAVFLVDLGHADFAPQQSHLHRLTP